MKNSNGILKVVEADSIKPGPLRLKKLPVNLYDRAKIIFEATFEVQPLTFKEFEEGFRRDINPLAEIIIWERIAIIYAHVIEDLNLSLDKKGAIFSFLLFLSSAPAPFDLSDDEFLASDEKKYLIELYHRS